MSTTTATLTTRDGALDLHVAAPLDGAAHGEGPGPWPGVVLYMDAFGIRPALMDMAERLAGHGYVVAVPNLYYRTPFAPFDGKAVSVDGPERDRFRGMIASITHAKVMDDTRVVIEWLDAAPDVRSGALAVVGYCMGGGYALSAAGTFPDRISVAASFHGGSLATDKPDSPHQLAPHMRARVYIGAAEIDATCPPEQLERLGQALTDAGVRHTIEVYPNVKHGFAVTGHLAYDQEASEVHWERLVQLLQGV
jgi:carboxymethylenebutenolidase